MPETIRKVIKIGSMALVRKEESDIDYNILSRLSQELTPGDILISSGATEIGGWITSSARVRCWTATPTRSRPTTPPKARLF